MKKQILLIIICLIGQITLKAHNSIHSREVLADTIANKLEIYVSNGSEELIKDEFSLIKYPTNIWNYIIYSKETRRKKLEVKIKEFISLDSIVSITNKQINYYNITNKEDVITPITITHMRDIVSDQAMQAVQDRTFLDVVDLVSEGIFWIIAWCITSLATYFIIAPWLSAQIYDIEMMEVFGKLVINKATRDGSLWNSLANFGVDLLGGITKQNKIEKAKKKRKQISTCVIGILTVAMCIWQAIETPKKEAKAKEEIQNSYIEVLSQQNIFDHILNK